MFSEEADPMAEEQKELIEHDRVKNSQQYRSFLSDLEDEAHENEKKDCWLSAIVQLNSVSLVEQQFDINATFSVFWIDAKLTQTDIAKIDLFREGGINTGYELPLDPANLFKNASTVDHIKQPSIEIYDEQKHVIMLKCVIHTSLHEQFELTNFPFDAQFLNVKMIYNTIYYNVLSEFPKQWIKTIELGGSGHYDRALKVSKLDSLTNWVMLPPWFDFRTTRHRFPYKTSRELDDDDDGSVFQLPDVLQPAEEDGDEHEVTYYRFKFALIRLRLKRVPNFYFQLIIFPLFLIVSCSFAAFSMDPDEWVGDRLGFVVTLLLTVVAFQYAIQGDLPASPEVTHIDRYIIWAYLCLTLFIVEIAIANLLHVGYYTELGERIMMIFMIVMWLGGTVVIIVVPWTRSKQVDWESMSNEEMEEWDQHNASSSLSVDKNHMHGTNIQC